MQNKILQLKLSMRISNAVVHSHAGKQRDNEQTEKGHFTEQHHTTHKFHKISTCSLLLKRLF